MLKKQMAMLMSTVMAFLALLAIGLSPARTSAASNPGGFIEKTTDTAVRSVPTAAQISAFMPSTRGPFTFPAPYNTKGVRITDATDCTGGQDCVQYVGYSYWRNINNHVGRDHLYMFLGLNQDKGGSGVNLFRLDKATDQVTKVGPLFTGTGLNPSPEGMYFSGSQATKVYLLSGSKLIRFDVETKSYSTVFDSLNYQANTYLWQAHSSDDDRVHSATLREEGTYAMLGCIVYKETTGTISFYASAGGFDECQVDRSGNWLVIKDQLDGLYGEDNRIIDLNTGTETTLLDQNGAAGHSDNGYGYMVAADNWHSLPNAERLWKFGQTPLQGTLVYHDTQWGGSIHTSHTNAKPGVPAEDQYACNSSVNRQNAPRMNEVVCYRLNGSLDVLVVAPIMTNLDAPGGGDDYSKTPKGNLDVTGEYFIWTTNLDSSRLDAVLVKVPSQLLYPGGGGGGGGGGTQNVVWTSLVNATATGNSLQKTGGGDSVEDAGAVSQQTIASGNGSFEFTATETDKLRFAGLSNGNPGVTANEIDFAIRLQTGYAEVRESGVYKADTPFVSGDRFKIAVEGGVVKYYKNGGLIYTSSISPTYPLLVDTSLFGANSTITNATLMVPDTTPPVISAVTTSGVTASGATVTWTTNENSDSQVEYGTTTAYGSQTQLNTAQVTSHSIPLSGLSANTLYHYRVKSRDAAGNLAVSGDFTFTTTNSGGGGGVAQNVVWTSLVNATATGNSLQKTGGVDSVADAGAVSQQTIASGNGAFEFTATETDKLRFVGLSNGNPGVTFDEIDFAIRLQSGYAEIRESNVFRADTPFVSGDRFKISVEGGVVKYYKNGGLIYTSSLSPTYPLLVDTSLIGASATITNATITGGTQNVVWTSLVNATATGNSLQKTGGVDSIDDAGAVSQQTIASGNGSFEFTATETDKFRFAGLSNGNPGVTANEIDFAIRLQSGYAEVRESGVYKADTPFVTGDRFKISVESGVVKYYKNGGLIYTSSVSPTYPLLVDTSLFSTNATITNATLTVN